MAIPDGFIKPTPNVSYYNVDYYIDSSVRPSSDLKYYMFGSEDNPTLYKDNPTLYKDIDENPIYITTTDGDSILIGRCGSDWSYSFVNGKVEGIDTINVYMELDEDWLYIKESAPQPATKNVTITLDSGVESATFVFNEPELPKVNLRVYTTGDVSTGDYGVSIKENSIEIYNESGTYDAIDVTKQVTQGNSITVKAYGSPWFFTIKVDGVTVVNSSTDGAVYTFTISSDTSVEIYCNYD